MTKDVVLSVDGTAVTLRVTLRVPRAVDLPLRGDLDATGPVVPSAEVARPLPVHVEPVASSQKKGVTIAETAALITDPSTGKYPHANPFRDELLRAIRFAVEVWGDVPWESVEESHWTALLRRRCAELVAKDCKAVRATEITVSRLITAVGWLRETRRVGRDAAPWPKNWKRDIAAHWRGLTGSDRDQLPSRQRYTLEEFQRILRCADFDPRLYLLLRLAIGLRPGQVSRARRSDLVLPAETSDESGYGSFTVVGAGKKGGVVVDLTRGQREAIDQALTGDGYLARVEARYQAKELADYRLFPSGYVVGRVGMLRGKETKLSLADTVRFDRHVTPSWLRKGWRRAEERAGIAHELGRSTYGQRRLAVDQAAAAGLSPSGIQATGGWSDTKMPLTVYAEQENRAGRREARPVRAKMLGELV